jgi:hypothetical protein
MSHSDSFFPPPPLNKILRYDRSTKIAVWKPCKDCEWLGWQVVDDCAATVGPILTAALNLISVNGAWQPENDGASSRLSLYEGGAQNLTRALLDSRKINTIDSWSSLISRGQSRLILAPGDILELVRAIMFKLTFQAPVFCDNRTAYFCWTANRSLNRRAPCNTTAGPFTNPTSLARRPGIGHVMSVSHRPRWRSTFE